MHWGYGRHAGPVWEKNPILFNIRHFGWYLYDFFQTWMQPGVLKRWIIHGIVLTLGTRWAWHHWQGRIDHSEGQRDAFLAAAKTDKKMYHSYHVPYRPGQWDEAETS